MLRKELKENIKIEVNDLRKKKIFRNRRELKKEEKRMGVKNKIDRKKLEEVMKKIRIMKENEESRHTNSEIGSNISNVENIKSRGGSSYGRSMCTDISEDR